MTGMDSREEDDGSWSRISYWTAEEEALPKGREIYLAVVKQRDGEYEEQLITTVEASGEQDAEKQAFASFLRCELGKGAYEADGGVYDRYGEVHYSIQMLNRLDPEEALIFKRFHI